MRMKSAVSSIDFDTTVLYLHKSLPVRAKNKNQ